MNHSVTRHLPNFITCLNLASGCLAVVFVFKGDIPLFAACVAASLFFDFMDGFVARALDAYSPMGKELDSLADMVTFGFVPGAIMYHLFINSVPLVLHMDEVWAQVIGFFPFIITIFSALRLAKFNVDARQAYSFLGLPTPAVTIFVVGIALIIQYDRFHLTPSLMNTYVIGGLSMILSFLLVSEIPLFALKFRNFSWQANKAQYLLLAIGLLCVITLEFTAIPLLIIFYLILSVLNNRFRLNREDLNPEK